MDEFHDEKAKSVFFQTMLNTLLVEFFRDTNIAFVEVQNSRFKALLQFLCPSVTLPSHLDLIKLNVDNYNTFKAWEMMSNSSHLNEERLEVVGRWAKEKLEKGNEPDAREVKYLAQLIRRAERLREQSSWRLPKNSQIEQEEDRKSEYFLTDFQEDDDVKPSLEGLADFPLAHKPSIIGIEIKRECMDETNNPNEYQAQDIKLEEEEVTEEGAEASLEHPPPIEWQAQDVTSVQGLSPAIILPEVPESAKWLCIVCNQRKENQKLRNVLKSDGYFMIYTCTQYGKYSLEYGKELFRLNSFKCCIDHFDDMHHNAKRLLNIIDPRRDICSQNQKVVEAYHSIREMKNVYYDRTAVNNCHVDYWPFTKNLKRFFRTYGRHNYVLTKRKYQ